MVCPGILSNAHFEPGWLQSVAWMGGGGGGGKAGYNMASSASSPTLQLFVLFSDNPSPLEESPFPHTKGMTGGK